MHLGRHATLGATLLVCLLLYAAAAVRYPGFFSAPVAVGFFAENAFLGIAALGLTVVLISGGIDLSVGAMVGCASILIATLVQEARWHPGPALLLALVLGTSLGAAMGGLIHAFRLPAFIVTLAGMFLARGMALVISREALSTSHGFLVALHELPGRAAAAVGLEGAAAAAVQRCAPTTALLFLIVALAAGLALRFTRLGRCVYAAGSDEESARLMGLPVAGTKVAAYAASGFCSSLAGGVYVLYTRSGSPTAGTMLELDAIAVAVIGGTSLLGGRGSVAGTVLGVVIFGIIQTAIIFDGRLSSWWTRIAVGALLLAFILLQRLTLQVTRRAGGAPGPAL